ncbi:GNAT family N-acetyltransferase [bacterium]|nr:GNAT family N-acetyltransferase [bacterium]
MIATDRLNIWPIERQDLNKNYQWANDMELCHLSGALPLPKPSSEIEGWFSNITADPEIHTFSMKLKDGTHIGNIEIRDLDLRCGSCELGIIIGEKGQRHNGYGSEAVRALCAFCFKELRLHRIMVHVLSYNEAAFNMFCKCGFQLEGTMRQAFFYAGRHWDVRILSLLNDNT